MLARDLYLPNKWVCKFLGQFQSRYKLNMDAAWYTRICYIKRSSNVNFIAR